MKYCKKNLKYLNPIYDVEINTLIFISWRLKNDLNPERAQTDSFVSQL